MSSLPPVLVNHSVKGNPGHTVIDLVFNEQIAAGSGTVIVTDGALQTVIDRATGLPTTRIVGATDTKEIPLSMVSFSGNTASISADGLVANHEYRVLILPGVLTSGGLPFAGVSNGNLLKFTTPAAPVTDTTAPFLVSHSFDNLGFSTIHPTAKLTLTFSEAVQSFSSTALSGNGLTFGAPTSSDGGMTWKVDVTAQNNINLSSTNLTFDPTRIKDLAGNASSGLGYLETYNVDTKLPAVDSIVLNNASPVLQSGSSVTIKFTESVHLGPDAIVAPHAIVGMPTTSDGGLTWVVPLAPASGGASTGNVLSVDMTKVTDLASNAGIGAVSAPSTYTVDLEGPGIHDLTLSAGTLKIGGSATLTIHMQQAIPTFDKSAIVAPNAIVGNDLQTTDNGLTWTVTLTPQAGVTASQNDLSIDLGKLVDANGVHGAGSMTIPHAYDVDTQAPTATLSLSGTKLSASMPVFVTIHFSEPMRTLDKTAIIAANAAVDSLTSSDNGATWTAKLLPTTQSGTVSGNTVSIDMTKVSDLAGNSGAGSVSAPTTFDVDAVPPTTTGIGLSGSHASGTSGPTMSITFSEAVSFDPGAFTVPHARLSNLTTSDGGKTWTATVLADGTGNGSTNAISLDLTKVHDQFGNPGFGQVTSTTTYAVDSDLPTATITLGGNRVSQKGTVDIVVKFSEAVKDVPVNAFDVPNAKLTGPLTSTDGGITWRGTLASNANVNAIGNVLKLNMTQVQDLAGNPGSGYAQAGSTYDVDVTPPTATLALSSPHLTSAHAVTLTITFSEAVSALDPSWITASPHATVSDLFKASADGTVWTATLTTTDTAGSTGNLVSLDMTKVTDLAGNNGSSSATATFDVEVPVSSSIPYVNGALWLHDTGVTYDNPDRLTDFITSDGTINLHGHLSSALSAGQSIDIVINNQHYSPNIVVGDTWFYTPTSAPTLPDGTYTISVSVKDSATNTSSTPYTHTLVVDSHGPQIISTSAATSQDASQPLVIHFDEPVSWYPVMNDSYGSWTDADNFVKLVHGTVTEYVYINQHNLSADGKTLTISADDMALTSGTSYTVSLPRALTDVAGNPVDGSAISFMASGSYTDSSAPRVVAVLADDNGTTLGIGQQVGITVKFNEPVKVKDGVDWPELTLTNGGKATYQTSGSHGDARTMYFLYTVKATDLSTNGYLDLLGMGTLLQNIVDLKGNPLAPGELHLSSLYYPVEYGSGIVVNTSAPASITSAPVLDISSDSGVKGDLITRELGPGFHGGDATPGATVVLYDLIGDDRMMIGRTTANADGSWHINPDGGIISAGTHQLAVGQINAVGNPSAALSPSISLIIDRTDPAPLVATLDAGSDGGVLGDWITAMTTPTVTIAGVEAGASVVIMLDDSPLATPAIGSDGKASITLPTLATGVHHLSLQQTDAAGNSSIHTIVNLNIDPAAVIVTAVEPPAKLSVPLLATDTGPLSTDGITNNVLFKGKGAVANATIDLMNGQTLVTSTHALDDGTWSLSLPSGFADGSYTFTVRQTDSGHHTSADSDTFKVTLDTKVDKLAAPTMSTNDDAGYSNSDLLTNVVAPAFSGDGAEPNATIELMEGTKVLASGTADTKGHWSLGIDADKLLIDGGHDITVRQTDLAGNSSTSEAIHITIDTSPSVGAAAPKLSLSNDSGVLGDGITWSPQPMITGLTVEPNVKVELLENGVVIGAGFSNADRFWQLFPDATLVDGVHHLSTRETDAAGNISLTSAVFDLTIDTKAPATPTVTAALDALFDGGVKGDLITNNHMPKLYGGGMEANADVVIYDTFLGKELATVHADAQGNWSYTPTTALADGDHGLMLHQVDAAGNASGSGEAVHLVIDTTVAAPWDPALAFDSDSGVKNDLLTSVKTPALSGMGAEAGAKIELFDGDKLVGSRTADGDGVWHITTTELLDGLHSLTVRQTDVAGNISQKSNALPLTIDTTLPADLEALLDPLSDKGAFSNDHLTNDTTPTLKGTGAEQFAYIELYDGVTKVGDGNADDKGNWSVTPWAPLDGEGEHRLSVRQYDAAYNKGALSEPLVVNIDTTAPTVTSNWKLISAGIDFELVFSERVVPISTTPIASFLGLSASLPIDITNGTWTDTTIGGHDVTVYHALLLGAGSVDISLSLLQDLAGNKFAEPVGHFIVPLTSFFEPPPLL